MDYLRRLFDLTGKTALVTGCDKGIGKGMAVALAAAGADIVGVSRSIKDDEGTALEVRDLGRQCHTYQADLGERDSVYACIQKIKKEHPTIDILVNNAGTILRKPVAEHPDEYWDKVLAINLDAVFILTREFGKDMLARGKGKVIFTCSMLSYQGGINVPGYTASKSAIAGLVKAFSNEWAGQGVHVNGIAPGYVATDNTAALRGDEDRSRSILERIPANRWGTPEDFAGATIFLASESSDYVDGTILNVDGGWMGR